LEIASFSLQSSSTVHLSVRIVEESTITASIGDKLLCFPGTPTTIGTNVNTAGHDCCTILFGSRRGFFIAEIFILEAGVGATAVQNDWAAATQSALYSSPHFF
jgi:hypothetical protein